MGYNNISLMYGSAVITPGFKLKAKYIIHAVGHKWIDGNHGEPSQLYDAYKSSLELAKQNGCRSIGFPLISAGIFCYPKDGAWRKAVRACVNFIIKNPDYQIEIIFAILDDKILSLGEKNCQISWRPGRKWSFDKDKSLRGLSALRRQPFLLLKIA